MKQLLFAFILVVQSLAAFAGAPSATTSEYFKTTGGAFVFAVKDGKGTPMYAMTYRVIKKSDSTLFVTLEFENPEPGSKAIIVEKQIEPTDQELSVQSPALPGITNNKNYTVVLRAYTDEAHTNLVVTHIQQIQFSVGPQLLQRLNLNLYAP